MTRMVKQPEERRRELLATAMKLFANKGYDNVSVREVAREAGVTPGLAYHYFDSKQSLFAAAIEDYAQRCATVFIEIFDDTHLTLDEKITRAIQTASNHDSFPYASLFHAEGSSTLHDRLSLGLAEAVRSHLKAAIELDALQRNAPIDGAEELAAIMTYSCIGLASGTDMPNESAIRAAERYFNALINEFRKG